MSDLQERATELGMQLAPETDYSEHSQIFEHDDIEIQDYAFVVDEISWTKMRCDTPEVTGSLTDEEFSSPYTNGDVVISKDLYNKVQEFIQDVKESGLFLTSSEELMSIVEQYHNLRKNYNGIPVLILQSRFDELLAYEQLVRSMRGIICK